MRSVYVVMVYVSMVLVFLLSVWSTLTGIFSGTSIGERSDGF